MQQLELSTELVEEAEWAPTRERGLWSDAFRALRRNRLAIVALVVVLILSALAVSTSFTHVISRYDPYVQDYNHVQEGPTWAHFFGTDNLGRDNWARVLTGIDISLQIGIGTQILVLMFGMAWRGGGLGGRTSDNIRCV
jgi:ABC-type dipeptide/oligopeptide/nickel transport system permease subunit